MGLRRGSNTKTVSPSFEVTYMAGLVLFAPSFLSSLWVIPRLLLFFYRISNGAGDAATGVCGGGCVYPRRMIVTRYLQTMRVAAQVNTPKPLGVPTYTCPKRWHGYDERVPMLASPSVYNFPFSISPFRKQKRPPVWQ